MKLYLKYLKESLQKTWQSYIENATALVLTLVIAALTQMFLGSAFWFWPLFVTGFLTLLFPVFLFIVVDHLEKYRKWKEKHESV